ncbi:hypothetical protein ACJV45_01720 [Gardnerella sp. Marseille-Q9181]|uniref:hypothetical protein n=1 Tax=Gardnerella sp. Marseille-Q9181 TaxID=3383029 RepID=UPI003AF63931
MWINTNKTVKTHCFKVFKEFSQTFLRKLLKQEHQHYKTIEKSTFLTTHTRNTPTPHQHQTGTAQTSQQTEYHTGATSNATLQDNRTQLTSRVCSLFDPFGKQKQEHLPEIVYVFGDFGNKHGIKETNAGKNTQTRTKKGF